METTVDETRIVELIVRTLRALGEEGVVDLDGVEPTATTDLFGAEGLLDSIGLVSLVVAVEEALDDELGIRVGLADDRALSQRHSPYRTVSSLAGYAAGLAPAG
ncbi:MAG: acyl carrier protein [Pseudonocardia sp.]|nr:acyl carrier protein [Pseudonocardia sp.]